MHKNTHHVVLCKRNSFLSIFRSPVPFLFLFYFRGRRCLILLNGVLFTDEIPNEIILLCIDYGVALRLEKN